MSPGPIPGSAIRDESKNFSWLALSEFTLIIREMDDVYLSYNPPKKTQSAG